MSVSLAEIGLGRLREQFATKRRLTTTAMRQDKQMLEKLNVLRASLEETARTTRDPETARQLRLIIDQVVAQMERLEDQDRKNNALRGAVDDADAAQLGLAPKPKPLPRIDRRWRP